MDDWFSYGIFRISYTIIIHIVFLRIVIFYESTYLNHLHLPVSISFSYKNNNIMLELFVKLFGNQSVFLWWLEDTPYFWFGGGLDCLYFLIIYKKVHLSLTNDRCFQDNARSRILFHFLINREEHNWRFNKTNLHNPFACLQPRKIYCIISSSQIQQSAFCIEGPYEGS